MFIVVYAHTVIQYTNIVHVNTSCNYTFTVYNNIHIIKVVTSKVKKKTHYRRKCHIQSINFLNITNTFRIIFLFEMKLYIHFNHDWSLSVGSIKTESTEVPKYTGVKMMMNAFSFYRLAVENQEVWGNSAIKLDFRIKCAVINGYCGIIFIFWGGGFNVRW